MSICHDQQEHQVKMNVLKGLTSPQGKFFTACIDGDKIALKKILAQINIDAYNSNGLTGAHLAVQHGRPDVLGLLIDAEIDLKAEVQRGELSGYTVTHLASMLPGRGSCLQVLLRRTTSHVRTEQGWTPLHCAAFSGRFESVRLLLEADCNPDVQTHDGRTPLMMASNTAMVKIVRLLLGAACNTSITDHNGYTALEHSLDIRSFKILPTNILRPEAYECSYLLILSGCSVSIHSDDGGPFRYVSEQWNTLFTMVSKYRIELLRGGALPFAGFGGATLAGPCGLSFRELLTAESAVLESIGMPYADVKKLITVLPSLWIFISKSTAALSPQRKHYNRPTPPTNFSVSRFRWLSRAATGLRNKTPARLQTIILAVILYIIFWIGVMAERYKQHPLLYVFMYFVPDPFYEPMEEDPDSL